MLGFIVIWVDRCIEQFFSHFQRKQWNSILRISDFNRRSKPSSSPCSPHSTPPSKPSVFVHINHYSWPWPVSCSLWPASNTSSCFFNIAEHCLIPRCRNLQPFVWKHFLMTLPLGEVGIVLSTYGQICMKLSSTVPWRGSTTVGASVWPLWRGLSPHILSVTAGQQSEPSRAALLLLSLYAWIFVYREATCACMLPCIPPTPSQRVAWLCALEKLIAWQVGHNK